MSLCAFCKKPSENLRAYKNFTTSAWSQSYTKSITRKRFTTTTHSYESDVQSHSYQVCRSCILKRDLIPGLGSIVIGIIVGILIAINYYSPQEGIGNFFLYFCPTSLILTAVGFGIWLFTIQTENALVRKSIQSRRIDREGKYKGYTEAAWNARK